MTLNNCHSAHTNLSFFGSTSFSKVTKYWTRLLGYNFHKVTPTVVGFIVEPLLETPASLSPASGGGGWASAPTASLYIGLH